MKKLTKLLIFLILIYIFLQIIIIYLKNEHKIYYKIDGYEVKETKTNEEYYFEINFDKDIFNFKNNSLTGEKIINKVYTYSDEEYKCVLPTLKNKKLFTDMLCKKDNIYYFYQSIKGKDDELDTYIKNLKFYKIKNQEDGNDQDNLILYNKLPKKIAIENYKGLYIINNIISDKVNNIDIFDKDIYEKDITTFINNYYLIADYNEEYEFRDFYLVDLKTGKNTKITSEKLISMYSFIQGVVKDSVYLIDTRNKKQYEINIKQKTVKEIGDEKKGALVYKYDHFDTESMNSVINNKTKFEMYKIEPGFGKKEYEKVIFLNDSYYLYEKDQDIYNIYQVHKENTNNIIYLFSTHSIDDIIYDKNIFYHDKAFIYYLDDLNVNRKLIRYSELEYNDSLKFNIID